MMEQASWITAKQDISTQYSGPSACHSSIIARLLTAVMCAFSRLVSIVGTPLPSVGVLRAGVTLQVSQSTVPRQVFLIYIIPKQQKLQRIPTL